MFAGGVHHINQRTIGFLVALILLFTPLLSTASGSVRAAPAYTEVGGPIISNTTWTLANSPYIVIANVEVWQGVTLTIQPGVVVKFDKDKLLQVNGTLIARGTVVSPITFTSNQASPARGDWKNIKFTDSSVDATFDGAGQYTGGSILEYCVVEYGGNWVGGAIETDAASPLIDHCTVRNNDSSGIHAVSTSGSPVVIRNNIVSGNWAHSYWNYYAAGGGIYAHYSTVTGNTVSGNWANGLALGGYGGGIYAHYSTVTGNTVSGNSAGGFSPSDGGGIYAANSTVTGNTVSGNSASGRGNSGGGGIYAANSTVTGNAVSGNSANNLGMCSGGYGGGIAASYSTVTGNTVSGNSANSSGSCSGLSGGGGIYAANSTVTSNTVSGNSAYWGDGGGIYAEGSTVTGNTISGNAAHSSGGGGISAENSTVTGNTVSGNSARGSGGGGILAENSTVTSNTVSGNSASSGPGGGIDASGSTVTGNTVSDNSAGPDGGGISAGGSMVVSNIVSGNSAYWGDGGGISAGASTVMSNTVTANRVSAATGQGSGVYFAGSNDFLYNTIVGNTAISPTAVIGGVAIYGTPQFHHNNLYGNSSYDVVVLSPGEISGTDNYWGTVATVDILAHVYDGDDDSSRGRLLFIPYIQDPDPDAPVPPPRNLRADFTGGSASLSWDAIPSTTTGYGYKVYYDTDASGPPYQGSGAAQGNSPIDVGNATQFTLSGLGSGGVYIAVTAYDTQGRESWYSNEVNRPWRVYLPAVLKR